MDDVEIEDAAGAADGAVALVAAAPGAAEAVSSTGVTNTRARAACTRAAAGTETGPNPGTGRAVAAPRLRTAAAVSRIVAVTNTAQDAQTAKVRVAWMSGPASCWVRAWATSEEGGTDRG